MGATFLPPPSIMPLRADILQLFQTTNAPFWIQIKDPTIFWVTEAWESGIACVQYYIILRSTEDVFKRCRTPSRGDLYSVDYT